ncbi:RNI-like protein [Eremomyces bilateralis CBS 781.70]|uniref:RNI-like protein n=1 Tax=Eremomyces bilateralis CBS 781.70 TaxID=1392243 RepID=A0A6G1GF37_9PEZI|nr:RNI-like protein [Eremomyces bilateralis CBS 781.70]KAF1816644.1 RNI-like protein [Eremomyces bilateralis CBS 781.70]
MSSSPTLAQTTPIDIPQKLTGRKRLLNKLQRISSSPSLAKLGRSSTTSYRPGGRGSMSCVSLSSAGSPYEYSYGSPTSPISAGYSTAPTSADSSPGGDDYLNCKNRLVSGALDGPASVAVPVELRVPASGRISPIATEQIPETDEDNISVPLDQPIADVKPIPESWRRPNFNFWLDLPPELRTHILSFLEPKELVRVSSVSPLFQELCLDGQLWGSLDCSSYYRDIPASALCKIIGTAGPFVRNLNLRGCVQLRDAWILEDLPSKCCNLEQFSLEGCRIDRSSIHNFLLSNSRLVTLNLSGLAGATNFAMKIVAAHCPKLEALNVSWCNNIDTRGLRRVVQACSQLKDLRAGEVRGFDDVEFMDDLFRRNTLERLVLMNCDSLTDDALKALMEGIEPEIDCLTGRAIVPPRNLKHLDLTRCRGITNDGISSLAHHVPYLEGLQLSRNATLTDAAIKDLLLSIQSLTHLDLEELDQLTNDTLKTMSRSPFARHLTHLSISYCEHLGDAGMLSLLKVATNLESLDVDNTRVSDLVLIEAASLIRDRNRDRLSRAQTVAPKVGLRIVAFDCANVTWTGVREVLNRNAEALQMGLTAATTLSNCTYSTPSLTSPESPSAPNPDILSLKVFYTYQPTVTEHTRRILASNLDGARRLERKWADWMMMNEEAGTGGGRRRRRRAREAMRGWEEEEGGMGAGLDGEGGVVGNGVGRRRRARSGPGCVVM